MIKGKKSTPLLNFEKPPVVEAWIEFQFDLSEENIPWTEENAVRFINENFADYTPKHFEYFARIEVDSDGNPDFSKTDKSFNRIRAFSGDGQYCIQAGRNILIFNQINKGSWLGYDNMQNKAFEVLEKYSSYRHFEKLLKICLHYRDVITLPSENRKVELEHYFKIFPQLDEAFGDLSGFKLDLILPESCRDGVTFFTLLNLSIDESTDFKFQMDWHVINKPFESPVIDSKVARIWLDNVHLDIRKRFIGTFTEKTIKMFGSR